MKRQRIQSATVALLCVLSAGTALATAPEFAFGGGGPAFGLFMPDLAEINEFVEGAGYVPFDGNLILAGGGGRGGVVPGPVFGGAGWGAWIESQHDNLHAEYGLGLGGFDLGYAVGGNERSVLSLGAFSGAGAAELVLTEFPSTDFLGLEPHGIVIEPAEQTYDSVFAFVAPYVDMQIQLLDWIGLGVRAGYMLTLLELNWQDDGLLDPSNLAPTGLYVQFSIVFGGIGKIESKPVVDVSPATP